MKGMFMGSGSKSIRKSMTGIALFFFFFTVVLGISNTTAKAADKMLTSIYVTVTEPVAGTAPTFDARSGYASAYTTDPCMWKFRSGSEDYLIQKNTAGNYVFQAGITYTCNVGITLNSGYYLPSGIEDSVYINNKKANFTKNGTKSYILSYSFTVKAVDINTCSVSLIPDTLMYYRGETLMPPVTIRNNDNTVLKENVDYTLSYDSARMPGTAYVDVQGINNYSGTKSVPYTITEAFLSNAKVTLYGGTRTGNAFYCSIDSLPSSCAETDEVYNWCYSKDNKNWATMEGLTGKSNVIPDKYAGCYVYVRFYAKGHSGFADSKTIKLDDLSSGNSSAGDTPEVTPTTPGKPGNQNEQPGIGADSPSAPGGNAPAATADNNGKPQVSRIRKKTFRITYPKVKNAKGYQIYIAENKKFTKAKRVIDTKKTSLLIKKLRPGKTYYVKVRAYTGKKGKNLKYKKFSPVVKVKTVR